MERQKVLAINGSPLMERGNTAKIMDPFLDGMRDAGASVELFYLKRLEIKPCAGDFHCWYTLPGQCLIPDDMQKLYPLIRASETLVIATPVYLPLPGEMQNFLNRLMPIIEPVLETRDGRTCAKLHDDVRLRKIVLVSSGGWWEPGNFGIVTHICEEIAKKISIEYAGALLRPHADMMSEDQEKAAIITSAAQKAGHQLVAGGHISTDLLDVISQPLITSENLRQRYNRLYADAQRELK